MESLFKTRRNMLLNDHIANKLIMKKPILFLIVFFISVVCNSQSSKQDIIDNIYLSGESLTAYTGPLQDTLTPSPIGKKPFYISTYCRHGSRHLMEANSYTAPIDALKAAKNAGALTNFGNQILERMEIMNENSLNRYGELTKIGLDQWQGIAKRMIRNFPEIFADSSFVDGRSSIFIRCILSMETLLQELKAFNPQLKIFHDACENDMSFILLLPRLSHYRLSMATVSQKSFSANNTLRKSTQTISCCICLIWLLKFKTRNFVIVFLSMRDSMTMNYMMYGNARTYLHTIVIIKEEAQECC